MRRFRKALTDIREGRYLEAYSAFFLAVVVVAVNIVAAFVTSADRLTVLISSTIILLLGVITLATVEIRRDLPSSTTQARISRFFPSRAELPTLHTQLDTCHRRATIFGLQLGQVSHNLLPVIERRARSGLKINLALLSPVDRDGKKLLWIDDIGVVHRFPNLDELLRVSLRRLRLWHAGLDDAVRANVTVKAYVDVPTASVAIYDPDERHGYIHVEPILYKFDPGERPSFWVRRSDDAGLYGLLLEKYDLLWSAAIALDDLDI